MQTYCFSFSSNISNFIGIKYLKTEKITILYLKNNNDSINRYIMEKYLRRNGYKNINIEAYTENTFKYINSKATVLLPPLNKAREIPIYQSAFKYDFKKLFIEDDGDVYNVENHSISEISNDDVDLSVRNFINQTNGHIIQTNNSLFDQKPANELLDYLVNHLKTMTHILKTVRPLKKNKEFEHGHLPNHHAILDITTLNKEELHVYLGALRILERNNIISIVKSPKSYFIEFHELDYKEYFSKAGTWLEHYTQRALESFEEIDDVNSSVMFLWDDEQKQVKNEVDVMGVVNNRLIAVSCKDTMKLVDDYLYELESHADSLGSDEAIKIIVTTAQIAEHIGSRAKLLDVHIVNSVDNYDRFRDDINKVLNAYQ